MDNNKLRASAIFYANRLGWAVFPCHVVKDGFCSCGKVCDSPGKHPRTPKGFENATKDVSQIMRWWSQWPDANIGIATGAVSGIIVIDVDKGHGGYDSLDQLVKDYSSFETTPETITGSGGNHIVFKHPGYPVKNSQSKLGPGIDVRGDGGYIIAPPSIHPNGNQYVWDIGLRPHETPLADAPQWLLDKLKEPVSPVAGSFIPMNPAKTGRAMPSKNTLDFVANGAPIGTQRARALPAARNYLNDCGYTPEETIEKIWQGLSMSPQEPGKPAWRREDAEKIVKDLLVHPAPPLPEIEGEATTKARYRQHELEWIVCASAYVNANLTLREAGWLKPENFSHKKTQQFWTQFLITHDPAHATHEAGCLAEVLNWTAVVMPHEIGDYARQMASGAYLVQLSMCVPRLNIAISSGDLPTARRLVQQMHEEQPQTGRSLPTPSTGLDALERIVDDPGQRLIKTHVPPLDRLIRGLELQTQSIWAARAGLGKTTLLWQIARNLAASGSKVLFFSLEMSAPNLWGKAACGRLGIKWLDVLDGRLNAHDKTRLKRELDKMKQEFGDRLLIDDGPNTTETIWQAVAQYEPVFVLVDHLRLLSDKNENEIHRLGNISGRLKNIAKMGNCHVATIHQIRRAVGQRDDKRPQLDDLRDSGKIEEDGDAVFMLYRDSYYEKSYTTQPYYDTELLPVKFRYDPDVTQHRVMLRFDPLREFYGEIPYEHRPNGSSNGNGHSQHEKPLAAPVLLTAPGDEDEGDIPWTQR